MRLHTLNGKTPIYKNVNKYLVNWEAGCRSKFQKNIKDFFSKYWLNHVVYEEFPVYGTRMKVDILNATTKIAVEVNGEQHVKYNPFFHGKSRANFLKSIKRDVDKKRWLDRNGFILIEIYPEDVPFMSKEFIEKNFDITL
jgi:hypothetical protein